MSHNMISKSESGHRWKECYLCGTAYHHKKWFFAGRESKKEPISCPPEPEWVSNAPYIDHSKPWFGEQNEPT